MPPVDFVTWFHPTRPIIKPFINHTDLPTGRRAPNALGNSTNLNYRYRAGRADIMIFDRQDPSSIFKTNRMPCGKNW